MTTKKKKLKEIKEGEQFDFTIEVKVKQEALTYTITADEDSSLERLVANLIFGIPEVLDEMIEVNVTTPDGEKFSWSLRNA